MPRCFAPPPGRPGNAKRWRCNKAVFAELADQISAAKTADTKDFIDTRLLEELDPSGYIDCIVRTSEHVKV